MLGFFNFSVCYFGDEIYHIKNLPELVGVILHMVKPFDNLNLKLNVSSI